jgi:hypothetical protein
MTTTLTHVETFPTPSRGARNRSSLPRSVSLAPTHARPVSLDLVRQADDSSPDGYTRPLRHTGHTTNRSPGHRPTSRLCRGPDGWDDRIGVAASTSMRRANQATVLGYGVLLLFHWSPWCRCCCGPHPDLPLASSSLMPTSFVRSIVLSRRSRRQAAEYLALPSSAAARIPPLRDHVLFDHWISQRHQPGWPDHDAP